MKITKKMLSVLLCGAMALSMVGCEEKECEHEWIDATCEAPKTCEECDETKGEPLGHSVDFGYCNTCKQEVFDGVACSNKSIHPIVGEWECTKIYDEETGMEFYAPDTINMSLLVNDNYTYEYDFGDDTDNIVGSGKWNFVSRNDDFQLDTFDGKVDSYIFHGLELFATHLNSSEVANYEHIIINQELGNGVVLMIFQRKTDK